MSTDSEWRDATANNVGLRVNLALAESSDEWELLDCPSSTALPQTEQLQISTLTFWLNDKECVVSDPAPELRLIDYLRTTAGLTSAKQGCNEVAYTACNLRAGE